ELLERPYVLGHRRHRQEQRRQHRGSDRAEESAHDVTPPVRSRRRARITTHHWSPARADSPAHDVTTFTRGRGSSSPPVRWRRCPATTSWPAGPGPSGPGLAQPAVLYRRSGASGLPATWISLIRCPMSRLGSIV